MTDTPKTGGQVNPSATTLTTLYTVPGATSAAMRITICNQGVAGTFRLSLQVAGAADAVKQYHYFDIPIGANDTFVTAIIMMAATDVLKCYASHANMSFQANGVEFT